MRLPALPSHSFDAGFVGRIPVPPCARTDSDDPLVSDGWELAEQGDWEGAIGCFLDATYLRQDEPCSPDGLFALAWCIAHGWRNSADRPLILTLLLLATGEGHARAGVMLQRMELPWPEI